MEFYTLPEHILGDNLEREETIYSDYSPDCKAFSACFMGEPGTGKTLLAMQLANRAIGDGIPVIDLSRDTYPPSMIYYVLERAAPCIVILNELEKLIGDGSQAAGYVNLLSDINIPGVMFIITANGKLPIESSTGRPGRIRYNINFGKLKFTDRDMEYFKQRYDLSDARMMVLSVLCRAMNLDAVLTTCEVLSKIPDIAEAILISAFPGTGKSYFNREHPKSTMDSDSSQFSKDNFPRNYIDYLSQNHNTLIHFVSSHETVRKALAAAKMGYILVYPELTCKDEYLARYSDRGSPNTFIDLIDRQWDSFVTSCIGDTGAVASIVLSSGQYISDVVSIETGEVCLTQLEYRASFLTGD